jgi:alkylhydroperoxidase family enzyme
MSTPPSKNAPTTPEPGPSELPGAVGTPVALLALLAEHPELAARLTGLGNLLLHGGVLSAADRELLILRVAARNEAPYVESGHRPIAAAAGLRPGQIDRICGRPETGGVAMSLQQFALLRACDELLDTGGMRPATRRALGIDERNAHLLEIVVLVAHYVQMCWIANLFGLRPEQGAG